MANNDSGALSDVLDRVQDVLHSEEVTIGNLVERLGHHSFAALMLMFSLISASPASAVPGITATVGVIVVILVAQMVLGRRALWLPGFILRRHIPSDKLGGAIDWLRRPIRFVEGLTRPRLSFMLHRPWSLLPMLLILLLALAMPLMELIPTSGSLASAVIALFATGLLTRDGGFVLAALILLLGVPFAVWHFGPGS